MEAEKLFGSAFWVLFARVPREEQMKLAEFGDEYREFMRRAGRFFPK